MIEVELVLNGKKAAPGTWVLALDHSRVSLTNPQGTEVTAFRAAEAAERIKPPSFWESIPALGVVRGDGETVWFRPDKSAVRTVSDYLDRRLADQGPHGLSAMRRKGWLYVLGGLGLVMLGVVALVLAETAFNVTWEICIVPAIFGVIAIFQGGKTLRRCARASRISNNEDD